VHAGLASDEDALRYIADVPTSPTSTFYAPGREGDGPGALMRPGRAPCTSVSKAWLRAVNSASGWPARLAVSRNPVVVSSPR